MNNRFKEFNWIQTPEDWKDIDMTQKRKHGLMFYRLIYVGIVVMICISSLGLVYAYNNSFREWIHQYFTNDQVKKVQPFYETKKYIDGPFLCYYHEDEQANEIIDKVSIFYEGQFIDTKCHRFEGEFHGQAFAFDYYQLNDNIYTFNHSGFVQYTVDQLIEQDLYFGSSDMNLCCLNMETGKVTEITSDQHSVNFRLSPSKRNIMINKSDKYWTVYDVKTKQETKIEGLSGHARNSEYCFIDDWTILCFNEQDNSRLLDLKTMTYRDFNESGLYPYLSSWYMADVDQSSTKLVNMFNSQTVTLPYVVNDYNYTMLDNRYIILEREDEIIIFNLENKQAKVFHSILEESLIDVMCLDQKYIIFASEDEYVVLKIDDIFA